MPEETPLPYDLRESLIDIREASRLANVTEAVIRNWISRGYRARDGRWTRLPAERQDRKRYVRPIDVLQAEAATRGRARRRLRSGRDAL